MTEDINKKLHFHHVGIVVPNLDIAVENHFILCKDNQPTYYEEVESQRVHVAIIGGGPPYLEYIEPMDTDSPVYELSQKGGGLHHICFCAEDLMVADRQVSRYFRRISSPALGLMGRPMMFYFSKKQIFGVELIEIIEISMMKFNDHATLSL